MAGAERQDKKKKRRGPRAECAGEKETTRLGSRGGSDSKHDKKTLKRRKRKSATRLHLEARPEETGSVLASCVKFRVREKREEGEKEKKQHKVYQFS